ncbi:hypothetical protein B0A48_12731 [Cryoendolithus antarcticus]|uniref:Uncharacterized protein n=1 Tax=Cryoendolithus antarcticus TaxID=1507870 RepID=A0A1V8SRP9_9PEZI|nr:hypothetical protein B0A48_12731 [Cryoendolithus antarcticus]
MSLTEAYRLAHTAECRLNLAASRPDRSLRFVVGHLMTYESLRLRIVEIEHETSRSQRAKAVQFQGAGALRSSSSARRSPPPSTIPGLNEDDEDELSDDDDMDDDEDDEDNGLSLQRFPSGSARPPPLEADLEDDVDEDDEPVSPEEPDAATLETALKGDGSELLADAPSFGRMWELPQGEKGKEGVTRVIAEEMDGPPAPQVACTGLT